MGLFSKIFGGGGSPTPFTLPDKEARAKINKLSEFSSSDITGPSQAGQLTLDDLERQRQDVFNQQARMQQRDLSGQLSNMALFGGRGGGAGERLARQSGIQGELTRQGLFGDFAGLRTQTLAGDLASEQQRRDQARRDALNAELGILGARTSAELANRGADAQRKAQRGQLFSTLGALAGNALVPGAGGMIGGSLIGRGLFGG